MLKLKEKPAVRTEIETLRAEVLDLRAENKTLRVQLGQLSRDAWDATYWLQTKVWRQKAALRRMNARAVTHRFLLRTMAELGLDLSREQYRAALEKLGNPVIRKMIEDEVCE